jgi:hypothetical protein
MPQSLQVAHVVIVAEVDVEALQPDKVAVTVALWVPTVEVETVQTLL